MPKKINLVELRGRIIEKCTVLEFYMDLYISQYFANDERKQDEMHNVILACRMTWDSKRQVLDYILSNHRKSVIHNNPALLKDIQKIIEHRNIFAHYPIAQQGDGKGNSTRVFLKMKNTWETIPFTEAEVGELLTKLKRCIDLLRRITK